MIEAGGGLQEFILPVFLTTVYVIQDMHLFRGAFTHRVPASRLSPQS